MISTRHNTNKSLFTIVSYRKIKILHANTKTNRNERIARAIQEKQKQKNNEKNMKNTNSQMHFEMILLNRQDNNTCAKSFEHADITKGKEGEEGRGATGEGRG